jgi:BMFP domain-containing protein YqiC
MSKNLWKILTLSPAILGTALAFSSNAVAAESAESFASTETTSTNPSTLQIAQAADGDLLNQLDDYSKEGSQNSSVDQLTSVSQLRDVSPTDWAYEALRNLVERYGCIVGYPDLTYRGNRALSRYEFAAGLNSCMQQIERMIANMEAVLREDIETLKRLMKEFESELAALGARVDNLEGRIAFLEDHQFSTTTKLNGEVIFGLTQSFGSDNDNQAIFGDRVRLEFNTSFTGDDRLVTRLAAGNLSNFNNTFERAGTIEGFKSPTTSQTFNIGDTGNDIVLDWLAYYKSITLANVDVNTYVALVGGIHSDYAVTNNPYFEDYGGGKGALTNFATNNPIYSVGGGAGAAASVSLGKVLGFLPKANLSVGYLAAGDPGNGLDAGSPDAGAGIFNGDYSLLAQLNFNITDKIAFGFTYVNSYMNSGSAMFGQGTDTGFVGTTAAQFFDARKSANSYGGEMSWRVTEWMNFSGFFAYQDVNIKSGFSPCGSNSCDVWTYGGGFAFPDLGKEGSVLGIFAGVQPYVGNISGGAGQNPVSVEGFYKYQLTDNISITPGVIFVADPEQDNKSNSQVIGTLRTTFTF